MNSINRREIAARDASYAKKMARFLAQKNISPNQISSLSMVFAAGSLVSYFLAREHSWALVLAVVFIQLRLICNLLDGMVAIEYNKKSKVGDLYNEVPDRISDTLILLGAGLFVSRAPETMNIAWACVFLSCLTAYLRVFGASLVNKHYFLGPMAKQHRMAVLSVASLVSLVWEPALYFSFYLILLGLVVTCFRRVAAIARDLNKK
jgi:phosphatidylglycerophosphate synthase